MPSLTSSMLVAGAADALQAARHRRRRFDLDHQIDRAHVDAELERRGGDQRAQVPALEQVFDLGALRPRQRAVMRAHQRLAGQLVERAGQPLGQAAAVDEQQRRAMRRGSARAAADGSSSRSTAPPAPATAGPLGCSTGLPIAAMSSTGVCTRDRQLLRRARIDDRDRPVGDRAIVLRTRRAPIPRNPASRARVLSGVRASEPSRSRVDGVAPPRNRATSSSGRCVADSPMRCSGLPAIRSSRSSDSARCAPRLVETSAWISSMITVSTDRRLSCAFEVSSRNSDSGVVIRMSAGAR